MFINLQKKLSGKKSSRTEKETSPAAETLKEGAADKTKTINQIDMKNKKPILFSAMIVVLFSITLMSGCKKEETTDACTNGVQDQTETGVDCGGTCNACTASAFRIKTVTYADGSVFAYSYDNRGRITNLAITSAGLGNSTQQYTYGTNSVTQTLQGGFTENYTLNSNGYATSQVSKDNTGATIASWAYTYDSEGHVLTSAYTGGGGGTVTNTWTNGNLTSDNNFGGQTYTYLLAKDNTIGNENNGMNFFGKDSKNLRNSSTSGGGTTTFTYEYDSQNRVTKQMDGSPGAIIYTYY